MDKKIEVIKKQQQDIWKWVGTRKSAINCVESLIDEMIDWRRKQSEEMGEELLDVNVFKHQSSFPFVTIEFLLRPKQEE
ncbi:hypothetical protein [Niallia sp. FSL W8-0954]|jgi:hypothetical protein|uniref:hypothetical protein n=1 Tax=Niallia sp. FSL W8-0954 TaxID=2975338 RepID=UPI0030FD01C8